MAVHTKTPRTRLLAALALLVMVAASLAPAASAAGITASLGSHGGARWTAGTSVYVNLKAMTPGVWKQQLWSGTCAAPAARLVVLPSLVVPTTRTLAKTTRVAAFAVPPPGSSCASCAAPASSAASSCAPDPGPPPARLAPTA